MNNQYEVIQPSFIHESATIHTSAKIGPNATISEKCIIGAGVRIKDAIILPNCIIKENAYLSNCIVGWNSIIGKWSRIEGEKISESEYLTKNGVKTMSACVLAGENLVEDEVCLKNCIVLANKELKKTFHNEILM